LYLNVRVNIFNYVLFYFNLNLKVLKIKKNILTDSFKVLNVIYIVLNDYLDLISCPYPNNLAKSTFSQHLLVKGYFLIKFIVKVLNVLKSEKSFNSAFTESMYYMAHFFSYLLFVRYESCISIFFSRQKTCFTKTPLVNNGKYTMRLNCGVLYISTHTKTSDSRGYPLQRGVIYQD